jgi:PHD/YefM family antitoxin component YafN of YafNO toxin-antitoxin module
VREELKEQVNDPESDSYTTDKEKMNYVLEDRDEYRSVLMETVVIIYVDMNNFIVSNVN